MKKILLILVMLFCATNSYAVTKKEVLIFSQPCHYCELLKAYLEPNIIPNYPEFEFRTIDVQKPSNKDLLFEYVKKYDIKGEIGLPLMIIGDNYMMGWSDDFIPQLKLYLDEYKYQ